MVTEGPTITRNEMMDRLLGVCPSFRTTWESCLSTWDVPVDGLPVYSGLADFARHLAAMMARGETDTFPAIFALVERMQVEGDLYVQEATVVGLLEDMQNLNFHKEGSEPEEFRRFLGPRSLDAWDQLYVFWEDVNRQAAARRKASGAPSSPAIDLDKIQDPELRKIAEQMYRRT